LAPLPRALAAVPVLAPGEEADLARDVQAGIRARLDAVTERAHAALADETAPRLRASCAHLVSTLSEHLSARTDATPAQALMEADLAVALLECCTRVVESTGRSPPHECHRAAPRHSRRPRGKAAQSVATGEHTSAASIDVRLAGVRKAFGAVTAVNDVSVDIPRGSIFSLLGPPGAERRRPCA
jgi:ABC-type glutathione transport system ATPase component